MKNVNLSFIWVFNYFYLQILTLERRQINIQARVFVQCLIIKCFFHKTISYVFSKRNRNHVLRVVNELKTRETLGEPEKAVETSNPPSSYLFFVTFNISLRGKTKCFRYLHTKQYTNVTF